MQSSPYNFDQCPPRSGYGSLKWDKYTNPEILPLWVADMDFETAPEIIRGLQARLDHGVFGYTIPHQEPIAAVLDYLRTRHQYTAKAEWLHFLPGLVPAINLCCRAFAEADESIMTATPVYPPFIQAPDFAQRKLISVPLCLENNRWTLDFEAMEAQVESTTRVFILCNPHNPVGRVYDRHELLRLADFCERHDLILISDEIHCDLILDSDCQHIMSATLDAGLATRTVTLMAPSKTYNLPGLACAYSIIESPQLRRRFGQTLRGIITEVNCFGYAGCQAAYQHGETWRQALLSYLRGNYAYLQQFLAERLPEIQFRPMQATYLAWLDVSRLGLEKPAAFFEAAGVGLSDGTPFGAQQHLRLNFGCPRARLVTALERMERALLQRS